MNRMNLHEETERAILEWIRKTRREVFDEAALELIRHRQEFVSAIPELKRRVLAC